MYCIDLFERASNSSPVHLGKKRCSQNMIKNHLPSGLDKNTRNKVVAYKSPTTKKKRLDKGIVLFTRGKKGGRGKRKLPATGPRSECCPVNVAGKPRKAKRTHSFLSFFLPSTLPPSSFLPRIAARRWFSPRPGSCRPRQKGWDDPPLNQQKPPPPMSLPMQTIHECRGSFPVSLIRFRCRNGGRSADLGLPGRPHLPL